MWNPSDFKNMTEDELKALLLTYTPPNHPLHKLGDPYKKINFIDHVPDLETGQIIMRGTPLSRRTLGYMDEALYNLYTHVFTLYKLFKLMPLDENDYASPYFNQLPVDGGTFTTDYTGLMVIDCEGFDTDSPVSASIDGGDFTDEGVLDFLAAATGSHGSALDGGTF